MQLKFRVWNGKKYLPQEIVDRFKLNGIEIIGIIFDGRNRFDSDLAVVSNVGSIPTQSDIKN